MYKFYKMAIVKKWVGSAIQYKGARMKGNIITTVMDSATEGDYKLFVIQCDQAQHEENLLLPGVIELSEEQAIELAAEYQPASTSIQLNPETMKPKEVQISACDLRKFLQDQKD